MKSARSFVLILTSLLMVKIIVYAYLVSGDTQIFGGGNDAGYYDLYARGFSDITLNLWPTLLKFLNDNGLYLRKGVALFLFFISLTLLPWVYSECVRLKGNFENKDGIRLAFLIVCLYPTVFFFTTDIYRDVFMYFVFVMAIYCLKIFYRVRWGGMKLVLLLAYFFVSLVAFFLRDYLGASLLLALPLSWAVARYKINFSVLILMFCIVLLVAKTSGILEPLLQYRGEDGFEEGGASLGIGLLDRGALSFLALFFVSFFAQVFGVFIISFSTLFAFIAESVPFIIAFIYVLRNFKLADRFCRFLLFFFFIYSSIWVIGNDNLGTAVRLRVPGYLAIFACCLLIRGEKRLALLREGLSEIAPGDGGGAVKGRSF